MANRSSSNSHFNADEDIRLFRIRTSFWRRGRMPIDITEVKLSNPGPYIAISYEWGSNQVVSRIHPPDGGHTDLTESAYDIIEYVIRKRRRRDWVWMDSVCIDQKNQAEKRRQIALMGKIYSSASQVFACIGPEFCGGDEALRFVPKVFKILREHEQSGYFNKMAIAQRLQDLGLYGWTTLWGVLRSSFFERMWIVQEMIMAPSRPLLSEKDKSVMITSHKEDVPFVIIAYVATELRKLGVLAYLTIPDDDKSLPQTLLCAEHTLGLRQRRSNMESISVQFALYACVHHKAKYGVDKIYAVMNFVQDDQLFDALRAKFTERFCKEEDAISLARAEEDGESRSAEEDAVIRKRREEEDSERWTREEVRLFTFVAETFLKRDSPFNFLHMAGIGWPVRLSHLPSWAPDWNREDALVLFGDFTMENPYRASLNQRQIPSINSESSEVTVELILIDHIQRIFAHSRDERKRPKWKQGKKLKTESTTVVPSSSLPASWLTPIELDEIEEFPTHPKDYARPVNEARQFALESSHYARWRESLDGAVIGPFLVADNIQGSDIDMARAVKSWRRWAESGTSASGATQELFPTLDSRTKFLQFEESMQGARSGFKVMFGTSTQKLLGWGPSLTHKSDILCIIIGAMTPFLLRPVENDGLDKFSTTQRYRLVGECYVQGLMKGEGLTMGRRQNGVLV